MKNTLFDWSGVVRDTMTSQLWITNKIFERYEIRAITLEEFRNNWKQPYTKFYEKYLPKNFSEEDRSGEYRKALFDKECPKSKAFAEIVEVIKKCKEKGHFLAVVSSDLKDSLLSEIKEFGLENIFDENGSSIDDKYALDCRYRIELLAGGESKFYADRLPQSFEHLQEAERRFRSKGIDVSDSSVFNRENAQLFKFIDFRLGDRKS